MIIGAIVVGSILGYLCAGIALLIGASLATAALTMIATGLFVSLLAVALHALRAPRPAPVQVLNTPCS